MKAVNQFTFVFLRVALFIHVLTTPAIAQNFATVVPIEEETGIEEELDEEDKAQIEQNLTAEQLKQPIPLDKIKLDEKAPAGLYDNPSEYTLGFQDIIEVQVLRHPEVSGEFIINAEGNMQYEFVGDIMIAGLKKDEVKKVLTEKLSHYIINPDVTIKIVGYNSKIVYVVGEVGSPGKIFMRGDTITVREALVQAGLPLLSGKLKDAKVVTPDDTGKAKIRQVNVHKLLYEGDLRENVVMAPGDTLYIPPTFLAKAMRVISPVAAPISTASGAARTVYAPGF